MVQTVLFFVVAGIYVFSLIWLHKDTRRRTNAGLAITLLAAFFGWPLSLLIWVICRPPVSRGPITPERLNTAESCESCGYTISAQKRACPNCGRTRA